ncbi:MAG TPA: dTDP-4-dehydrorhamnose reductase [Bacteroidota bacterium]|nr:dTDP-4-dehydrorhamnose reductase [Bacteroidota bacterium]
MDIERILVVGSNGLLGQKVAEQLVRGSNYHITLASVEEAPVRDIPSAPYLTLDITNRKQVREAVGAVNPQVIINCAAMTNVDACETERETAWKINVGGVEHLIDAARKTGVMIVHVSSDYVFDGKTGPYGEDDKPEPLSYYGKTKLASENALRTSGLPYFVARTMVLYGFAEGVKANFALWLIKTLREGQTVRVVDDQIGNPTLVDDLAFGLIRGMELGKTGLYHLAGRDIQSRYEFALTLARVFHLDAKLIHPIKTAQLKQPAARPLKSGLLTLKAEVELGFKPLETEQGLTILKTQLSRARAS